MCDVAVYCINSDTSTPAITPPPAAPTPAPALTPPPPTPPTPSPTVPCPPGTAGPICEYTDAATCNGKGTANYDGGCTCQSGYSDVWSSSGRCVDCLSGYNGDDCQYSDVATCTGQGVVALDGTCSCVAGQTNGPHCEYSNAVTCNGRGVVDYQGSCACATGWSNSWGSQGRCRNCATGFSPPCTNPEVPNVCDVAVYCISSGTSTTVLINLGPTPLPTPSPSPSPTPSPTPSPMTGAIVTGIPSPTPSPTPSPSPSPTPSPSPSPTLSPVCSSNGNSNNNNCNNGIGGKKGTAVGTGESPTSSMDTSSVAGVLAALTGIVVVILIGIVVLKKRRRSGDADDAAKLEPPPQGHFLCNEDFVEPPLGSGEEQAAMHSGDDPSKPGPIDGASVSELLGEIDGVSEGESDGAIDRDVLGEVNGDVDGDADGDVDCDTDGDGAIDVEIDGEVAQPGHSSHCEEDSASLAGMASEVTTALCSAGRVCQELDDAETDVQNEHVAVEQRTDNSCSGHVGLENSSYEEESVSLAETASEVTTALCRAGRVCQELNDGETDVQNEHVDVDPPQQDAGVPVDDDQDDAETDLHNQYMDVTMDVDPPRQDPAAGVPVDVDQGDAETHVQNEYMAVDASRQDAGDPADIDEGIEFEGDDQGAIDATGRVAQSRDSLSMGSWRSSDDLGVPDLAVHNLPALHGTWHVPADSHPAARGGSEPPTEVEPVYDL